MIQPAHPDQSLVYEVGDEPIESLLPTAQSASQLVDAALFYGLQGPPVTHGNVPGAPQGRRASEQNVTGMLMRAGACEYVFFQGLGSGGM